MIAYLSAVFISHRYKTHRLPEPLTVEWCTSQDNSVTIIQIYEPLQ